VNFAPRTGTRLAAMSCMALSDIKHASIPELLSGLFTDAKELVSGHASNMRDEVKDEFTGLKRFLMKIVIAVGVGILGAILLAHAFALGLDALGLPQWAGYLIAALIFGGIGLVIVKRLPSDKKDIDLIPEQTFKDMKHDAKRIKDDVVHAT
jgi:hypothetical protein